MTRYLAFAALFLSIVAQPVCAQQMPSKDLVPKAADHPIVSRYQGSFIVGYEAKAFEEVNLAAGKMTAGKDGKRKLEKILNLEGRYTRIGYLYPKDRSSLEVMRNYENALRVGGFTTLFACAKESCGEGFQDFLEPRVTNHFTREEYSGENYIEAREPRYMLAQGTARDGTGVHVAVYVIPPKGRYNGGIYVEVVEAKKMDSGKVSVLLDANEMGKRLASEGKVAVYGVYFDTAKTDIKSESKAALNEMAALLRQQPNLKVYIIGHTDNQGALASNIELSQKRADAIAKSLADNYKINTSRMLARGVASFAPVTSNDNEDGRARNRRVELVKQ